MTRIPKSGGPRRQTRRRRLLLVAGYSLTTSLIAPTLHAAHCSTGKNGFTAGLFSVKSALPFLGDRYVQVKPNARKPATPAPDTEPSQPPTALSGDPR